MDEDPSNNGRERRDDGTQRFAKGNRFGRGRPAGSRNGVSLALDEIAAEKGADVLRKLLAAALGGDTQAATIVLSRLWPARRGRPVRVDLPDLKSANDVSEAISSIAHQMAEGELTPDEAAHMVGILESKLRVIETVDLTERIRRLEEGAGVNGPQEIARSISKALKDMDAVTMGERDE